MSLKSEGIGHVTAQRIDEREKMLKYVFGLCGFPYPLADIAPFDSTDFSIADKFNTPVHGMGSAVLSLVPAKLPLEGIDAMRYVSTAAHGMHPWPLRPLTTMCPMFQGWWGKEFPNFAVEVAGRTSVSGALVIASVADAPPQDSRATAKARDKMETIEQSVEALMLNFFGSESTELKEKDFTNILGRILRTKNELLESDVDASLVIWADTMTKVVSGCKKMVRPLREYSM